MTRLGWTILSVILVAATGFASMLSFGAGERGVVAPTVMSSRPATPAAAAVASFAVPVAGYARTALQDSWGDARGGGMRAHHGIDIVAPAGARVVAATPGTVEKLFESRLGGTTLYVRSADGGWVSYYAHLAGYAPGIREGLRVRAGDLLGFVGDTGDAGAGNYHLHFGLQRMRPGDRWWQGEDVNPYPLLARAVPVR